MRICLFFGNKFLSIAYFFPAIFLSQSLFGQIKNDFPSWNFIATEEVEEKTAPNKDISRVNFVQIKKEINTTIFSEGYCSVSEEICTENLCASIDSVEKIIISHCCSPQEYSIDEKLYITTVLNTFQLYYTYLQHSDYISNDCLLLFLDTEDWFLELSYIVIEDIIVDVKGAKAIKPFYKLADF